MTLCATTLAEDVPARTEQEQRTVAVLKTVRLVLRAPRREDAHAIAKLADDRRIAVNTARLPYPYGIEDAKEFIAAVNRCARRGHIRDDAR